MKLKKIFFISGFCIIIFLLISCGENKQKPHFTVSSNITNGKIKNDDTLAIKVNIINQKSKLKMKQGKKTVKSGYKKAIITLKKGQSIDLTTGI